MAQSMIFAVVHDWGGITLHMLTAADWLLSFISRLILSFRTLEALWGGVGQSARGGTEGCGTAVTI